MRRNRTEINSEFCVFLSFLKCAAAPSEMRGGNIQILSMHTFYRDIGSLMNET